MIKFTSNPGPDLDQVREPLIKRPCRFGHAPMKYQMDRLCSYSLSFKLILSDKTLKWLAVLLFSQMADIANTKRAVEMIDNFEFIILILATDTHRLTQTSSRYWQRT